MFKKTLIDAANSLPSPLDDALAQQLEESTSEIRETLNASEARSLHLAEALRKKDEIRQQLEMELEDARLLQSVSAMMTDDGSVDTLYQRLAAAATTIMRSHFGSLQRYDKPSGQLQLIANHGLNDEAIDFWQWVRPGRPTTCGKALEACARVVVPDFEECDFLAESVDLIAFRKAGVRAAQSTPLLTRNGELVGMITTHWTHPHEPKERDLRLLDIIARQAADLLERDVAMKALKDHADRLLEADRYKDEFLATLAHELRNPLAPIRTGLSLLKIGKPGQEQRILPMMERQLGHMVRLIDDLLDVSRISRGVVTLKQNRVALSAVIESAIETSRPMITAASHQFTVTLPGIPVWLDVDETRIAQVISNLLNNAAKYTPHGGKIELIAEVVGAEVVLRIADNGIGISADMQPRIFDLFTQVDRGTEHSKNGLGVGLALAKHLTEMHDGSIDVFSPGEGHGAVFTLCLPVAPTVHDSGRTELGEPVATNKAARILIVDDNADAAESLQLLLDSMGHSTAIVLESPKALATALEFKPDLMILDIGMPQLNGFELAHQIRNHEGSLRHTYLAVLSGWGTDEDKEKSRSFGINHHMTKPIMMTELESMLSDASRHGM